MSYRAKKYGRNKPTQKVQNNTILIVCGGVTEEIYFKKFNIELGEIRVKSVLDNRNPLNIVNHAIEEKRNRRYKSIWCVFDKDDFNDFDEAIEVANKNGINISFSNQAFELWLIMHFQCCNGGLHRNNYKTTLEKHIKRDYNKTDEDIYDLLKTKMNSAIERAREGHERHKLNGGQASTWESCTTVYELVRMLLRWKK